MNTKTTYVAFPWIVSVSSYFHDEPGEHTIRSIFDNREYTATFGEADVMMLYDSDDEEDDENHQGTQFSYIYQVYQDSLYVTQTIHCPGPEIGPEIYYLGILRLPHITNILDRISRGEQEPVLQWEHMHWNIEATHGNSDGIRIETVALSDRYIAMYLTREVEVFSFRFHNEDDWGSLSLFVIPNRGWSPGLPNYNYHDAQGTYNPLWMVSMVEGEEESLHELHFWQDMLLSRIPILHDGIHLFRISDAVDLQPDDPEEDRHRPYVGSWLKDMWEIPVDYLDYYHRHHPRPEDVQFWDMKRIAYIGLLCSSYVNRPVAPTSPLSWDTPETEVKYPENMPDQIGFVTCAAEWLHGRTRNDFPNAWQELRGQGVAGLLPAHLQEEISSFDNNPERCMGEVMSRITIVPNYISPNAKVLIDPVYQLLVVVHAATRLRIVDDVYRAQVLTTLQVYHLSRRRTPALVEQRVIHESEVLPRWKPDPELYIAGAGPGRLVWSLMGKTDITEYYVRDDGSGQHRRRPQNA